MRTYEKVATTITFAILAITVFCVIMTMFDHVYAWLSGIFGIFLIVSKTITMIVFGTDVKKILEEPE